MSVKKTVERGDQRRDVVAQIQQALNVWLDKRLPHADEYPPPAPLVTDGRFGALTESLVMYFQVENGLDDDGVVGDATLRALFPPEPRPAYKPPRRHKILQLSLVEEMERARGAVGAPINYHLEYPNGGTDPDSNMPCDEQTGGLDCSGLTAWVKGYDRDFADGMSAVLDRWGGYANTDSKIAEADRVGALWTPLDEPELGCLIVGESYRKLGRIKRTIGHEGFVEAIGNYKRDGLAAISVIHCSPSNVKKNPTGSAVWKTSALLWKGYPKLRFLRFNREYAIDRLRGLR